MNEEVARAMEEIGTITPLRPPEGMDIEQQKALFRTMSLIRCFDTRVRELWMDNKIYGLAHSYVGAEAIGTGACAALNHDDYITSTHRGHGHAIAKGANIRAMMAELFGKYEGLNRGKGGSMHIADMDLGILGATGIVGSGMPIAVGSAMSADLLGNGKVTVCFHGDGGTNQGVWHESINMAAAWNLPCVFLTENNQMAIGTKLCCITKETDLYKRAAGYGIPGVLVDGFNVFEVYKAVRDAVARARSGEGPTLIEARFLRLLGHFVADDQWYRDLTVVEPYWEFDPVKRMRAYFIDSGRLSEEQVAAIEQEASETIEDAITYASTQCTDPPTDTLYQDVYANGEVYI